MLWRQNQHAISWTSYWREQGALDVAVRGYTVSIPSVLPRFYLVHVLTLLSCIKVSQEQTHQLFSESGEALRYNVP